MTNAAMTTIMRSMSTTMTMTANAATIMSITIITTTPTRCSPPGA